MIEGAWVPQNEEEEELLKDLHAVTRLAAVEDVPKSRIASLLAFMASAASQQAGLEESAEDSADGMRENLMSMEEAQREAAEPTDKIRLNCPHCNAPLLELTGGFGTPRCPECDEIIEDSELVNKVINL